MSNPPNKPLPITSLAEARRTKAKQKKAETSGLSLSQLSSEIDIRTEMLLLKIDNLDERVHNLERNVQAILDILVKLKNN